jgi:hypothetical protein
MVPFTENYIILYYSDCRSPNLTLRYSTYITHFRYYRNITLLAREFVGAVNTDLLKCELMSVTMAPVIYKYILHNYVINEKFALLLHCFISVPFITLGLQVQWPCL